MGSREFRNLLVIAATLGCLSVALSACVGIMLGAGATGATAAAQERGFKTAASDTVIRAEINALWLDHDEEMYRKVTLSISEARVMLTGRVKSEEMMFDAVRLAWKAEGVSEVINEVQVDDQSGFGDFLRDTWISASLKTTLAMDERVESINYSIDAVSGIVYLFGIAQDKDELERVSNHAKNVSYVRKVVSHVWLKTDPRRKTGKS